MKANHNWTFRAVARTIIVPNGSKILIWKQITTLAVCLYLPHNCSQWFKDTNLKANHNILETLRFLPTIVPNGSKILIWKQITTIFRAFSTSSNCSQWFKDTNLKANHNACPITDELRCIVPNGSKILIWKQITTRNTKNLRPFYCSQWFKDTNLKANHNACSPRSNKRVIVPNGSKILIWKQITTLVATRRSRFYCSQWFKDTNLKANHNACSPRSNKRVIVPNGSKILIWKQITTLVATRRSRFDCSQWFKDTNLKANHNLVKLLMILELIVPNGSKILIWKQITTDDLFPIDFEELFPMVQRY